jgi:hypothetical protein
MGNVPFGAKLDARQRMAVAAMTGHAERLVHALQWPVDEQTIAELHAITTDPVVYGIALGNVLAMIGQAGREHMQPLADTYRAAGADLEVAERQRLWRLAQPGPI